MTHRPRLPNYAKRWRLSPSENKFHREPRLRSGFFIACFFVTLLMIVGGEMMMLQQHDNLLTPVNAAEALFPMFQQCSTCRNIPKPLILLCFLSFFLCLFLVPIIYIYLRRLKHTLYNVNHVGVVKSRGSRMVLSKWNKGTEPTKITLNH